eukprot:3308944-Pleurochrysis_carterae.AAC.9
MSRTRHKAPGQQNVDTTLCLARPAESASSLRLSFRLCGGQRGTRIVLAMSGFHNLLVATRLALGAVFVPVSALAPAAGGPCVAPLLVRLGSRLLWISRFATVPIAAYSENVRRAWVGFELAPHIAGFCIAQDAARCTDGES